MLSQLALNGVLSGFNILMGLLPDTIMYNGSFFDVSGLIMFLSKAFIIFPLDLFAFCMGNIAFWLTVQVIWGSVEFIIKKIPVVGIE